jgi:hypothetical protein
MPRAERLTAIALHSGQSRPGNWPGFFVPGSAQNVKRSEAYEAQVKAIKKRLSWEKIDAAYVRLMHRACRAADRILCFQAENMPDLTIKAHVHAVYGFNDGALNVFARDIERIARKAVQQSALR